MHAAVWVIASIVLLYFTDFFNKILYDQKISRLPLNIAIILMCANMIIMLYLTLWLPLVLKITIPWDIYCPNLIPASTILGVLSFIFLVLAFWPIWGFLSPLFITFLFVGLLFSTHFIPWPC
jgi:hypothetical protein